MLKANVGLSRKITRDYNSTGYNVNLEGEIALATDDHEGVLGRIKELFSLAEEALAVEIDRDQGEQAIGRHDEEPHPAPPRPNGPVRSEPRPNGQRRGSASQNSTPPRADEQATNKQCQYLLNLAKRHRLSTVQLEAQIADIIGRKTGVYELSKREAGMVIEVLAQDRKDSQPATQRN